MRHHTARVFTCAFIALVLFVVYLLSNTCEYGMEQQQKNKDNIQVQFKVHTSSKFEELYAILKELSKNINKTNSEYSHFETYVAKEIDTESARLLEYTKTFDTDLKKLSQEIEMKNELLEKDEQRETYAVRNTQVEFETTALCDDEKKGSKQVIAYSLFGKNAESYGRFISDVAREALDIEPYANFTIRVYVGETFSMKSRKYYKNLHPNVRFCDVRNIPKYGDMTKLIGTVWRFIPIADSTIDVFCSRDLDSPLLQRGGDAVNEWLTTEKTFHIMRDRSVHMLPIMGGMWCSRPSRNITLGRELLSTIVKEAAKSQDTSRDQIVLHGYVWPKIREQTLQHDSHFCTTYQGSKPFPTQRRRHFLGCVRDCDVFAKEICPPACRPKSHPEWINC